MPVLLASSPSDVILAQLACPKSDVMFWLHLEEPTYLSTNIGGNSKVEKKSLFESHFSDTDKRSSLSKRKVLLLPVRVCHVVDVVEGLVEDGVEPVTSGDAELDVLKAMV